MKYGKRINCGWISFQKCDFDETESRVADRLDCEIFVSDVPGPTESSTPRQKAFVHHVMPVHGHIAFDLPIRQERLELPARYMPAARERLGQTPECDFRAGDEKIESPVVETQTPPENSGSD